jgi:hypothetical protein
MAHVIEWLVAKFSGRSTTGREPTFHPSSFFKNLTITSAVGLELLNMLQICHTHSQSKHVANLFGSLFLKWYLISNQPFKQTEPKCSDDSCVYELSYRYYMNSKSGTDCTLLYTYRQQSSLTHTRSESVWCKRMWRKSGGRRECHGDNVVFDFVDVL